MRRKPLAREEPEQDPFFETVDRGLEFARRRAMPLTYAGITIVVVGVLAVWLVSEQARKRVDAFVQMYAAGDAFAETAQAAPEERDAELDDVVSRFDQVTAADYQVQARFMKARAAYEKGDFTNAAQLFGQSAVPKNAEVGLYAQLAQASSLERSKRWQDAANAYAESEFTPYASVPGYVYASTEAALGRGRVARELGDPTTARAAYEAVAQKYHSAQQAAIDARGKELVRRASEFLKAKDAIGPDKQVTLESAQKLLDDWIAKTLQKPEAQRSGLSDATRYRSDLEGYRRAVVDFKQAEFKARGDAALDAGRRAAGPEFSAPTREQYQRALLELARLDEMQS